MICKLYVILFFTDPEFFNEYFVNNMTSSEALNVIEQNNNGMCLHIIYTHTYTHIYFNYICLM